MLRTIALLERRHRRLRLLHRDARFQTPDAAHEAVTQHHALVSRVRIFERLDDEYLCVASEPRDWEIGQHPDNRRGDAVERDAPTEHSRIGAETFVPKAFRVQRNVISHFLLLKKI